MTQVSASQILPVSTSTAFSFLRQVTIWPELFKPQLEIEFMSGEPEFKRGHEYACFLSRYGLVHRCVFKVEDLRVGELMIIRQTEGLFDKWILEQRLEAVGDNQTHLMDHIEYQIPYSLFGCLLDDLWVRRDMQNLLKLRGERLLEILPSGNPK
jgi:hypothetical protein